ncbi:general transcription factor IIF subunit 1-like [Tubulanus polymorphus]|uniref:general transcription factor IIF subunit 1-like n=1 Tax=Tubulanus polymorphus TaxID=672921 RepID=UPI003DA5D0A6
MSSSQAHAGGGTSGSAAGGSATAAQSQEFKVRLPNEKNKKFSIMRFSGANSVDFTKCGACKIERENNLKEYKTANDLEQMPKFGAGSEFGREQKEEARKKKYGIMVKKYNPDDQPWILKTGGKSGKRYKGTREGTIAENTSYFIFTQCPDGAFEAYPIEEWYRFNPMLKYKYLNSEEAEEEFSKRDQTLNKFSVMLRRRIKNDEDLDDADGEEGEKGNKASKSKKKDKNFKLTEMDDWSDKDEDADENEDDSDDDDADDEKKKKSNKKDDKKKKAKKKSKMGKMNDADEAIEESDDGDDDDKEVDYITDSSSEEELDVLEDKSEDKGVVDEDGLRKLNESGDEDEEEEEKKEEEPEKEKPKKSEPDSDSSESSASDSDDSDALEEEGKFSALFMQKSEKKKSNKQGSRSTTPVPDSDQKGAVKRKAGADTDETQNKKVRTESPGPVQTSQQPAMNVAGVTEENVRRYLMRKPMMTKDILQKFNSKKTGLSNEQLVSAVAQILKKINPEKQVIQGKTYFHLKKE